MAQKPISQIKLPNGSTYNIDKGIYYIEGTGSTDTTNKVATWLGSHDDIPAYYNGLTILYKISTAGSTTTTLNINSLGAISVVKNANTAISTSYGVGSIVTLTYTTDGGTAYWKCADYDANTKTTTGTSNKASTKLFLTGATSQTSSGTTTYSNSKVYIGTDNCLYSNGAKVLTSYTDTNDKVTNELATTTKAYITGTTSATTNTGTQIFDTGVYLDTTAGQLVATTFKGALDGNAKTATTASSVAWSNVSGRPDSLKDLTNDLSSLTIGSKSYNGSSAITVTAADLGLANAMKFLGTTTTTISDGSTTSSISIGGSTIAATAGNVVLYDGFEYVWTGSTWEKLGDETSFKVKQTAVTSPTTNGNATAFIDTISQDANGKITVTKKNVSFPTLSEGTNGTATATLSHSGTFSAITDIAVSGHTITPTVTTFTLPASGDTDKKTSSGNSSSKLFLIGATSQSSSGQTTYSHDTIYAGTDGHLYDTNKRVLTEVTLTVGDFLQDPDASNLVNGSLALLLGTNGTVAEPIGIFGGNHIEVIGTVGDTAITIRDTLGRATNTDQGLVKIGSNITVSDGVISLTKANVTAALGYTPPSTDTNTHYTTKLFATSSTGTAHATTTNGNTYLRLFDDSTARQSIKITGSGATTVTSDANGVITISSSKFSGNYNDLTNKPTIPTIPSSLPANGGNADTVDNKHASDFAPATHTHNYAGSSSAGGAATTALACTGNAATATKVNKKLIIKLNGGSTEGTSLFTFDGSTAKTLNITASSIGAAPAYTYQTTDPGAGSSLAAGKLLIVYS